jgi:hypothetical protein
MVTESYTVLQKVNAFGWAVPTITAGAAQCVSQIMYGTFTELEALTLDHLVTITTHTPAGTGERSVDEMGTLQDAETNSLAAHLSDLASTPPSHPDESVYG